MAKTPEKALNLQEDTEFEDFITLDDDLAVCGDVTDAEIISSVTKNAEPARMKSRKVIPLTGLQKIPM